MDLFGMHIVVIVVTAVVSVQAFYNHQLIRQLLFSEGAILKKKQWYRLLSHALVHADWWHLIFNMMTLYFFAPVVIHHWGSILFLMLYILSVLGGGVYSLWVHRKEPHYLALGSSGGSVGVLFASIALYPYLDLYIIPIPVALKGWLFGILYLSFSVYSLLKDRESTIGHDAHIGGATIGIGFSLLLDWQTLLSHGLYIALMCLPILIGTIVVITQKR